MAGNVGFSDDDDSLLSDINVTPLVDVVLVLLIVFMITVPAIVGSAPVKVNLPETTAVAMAAETLPLIFSLRREADGELALYLNERKTDAASVRALVEQVGAPPDDQPVSLAADMGIPYGEVVKIMDLLQSMGLKKISLDTRHVEAP
jgi:biopolymer transport protein ExbD